MDDEIGFETLTRAELAAIFKVSTKTVTRWHREGLPREPDGRYSLPDAIEWALARAKENGSGKPVSETPESLSWLERFRRERFKLARIERRRAEEEVVSWAEVEEAWCERVGLVTSGLSYLHVRLMGVLPGKSSDEVERIVKAEVRDLRTAYAKAGKYCPADAKERDRVCEVCKRFMLG